MGPKYQVSALPIPGVDDPARASGEFLFVKRGRHNTPTITGEILERGDDETIEVLSLVNEMSPQEGSWEHSLSGLAFDRVDICLVLVAASECTRNQYCASEIFTTSIQWKHTGRY